MPRKRVSEKEQQKIDAYTKGAKRVETAEVEDFINSLYLPYAWSVCLDRALVYAQDGLKPIQRRILYTAYYDKITDKSPKIKSATFEGRVMKFSPHGGAYGSIVNIAAPEIPGQPRSIRVPLIRGKGNWGGIDLPAAAGRYTEMNLWPAAMELLKELDEDAVDMVWNYDNTAKEPVFLPARWPVALINGVPDAMAVGFACNLPSHNPDEIMDACIALAKNPKLTDDELLDIVKGPDFDCGCDIITDTVRDGKTVNGVRQYLLTGSGSFTMRACYELSESNGQYTINFRRLPYKISPEKVIDQIKDRYSKGDFKELQSWKNLSDNENPVDLEITTKKNINLGKVLADLYSKTSLQCVFAANNTVVVSDTPTRLGVREIITQFLQFRHQCTTRKLNYRLNDKRHRLELREAIAAVLVDIDKCISIIRNSKDEDAAKKALEKQFSLTDSQASYILSVQLRRLTKSDSIALSKEIKSLKSEIKALEKTLGSDKEMWKFIVSELEDTKQVISSPRKCTIMQHVKSSKNEDKDVFLRLDPSGKVMRTFKETEDSFKVGKDGRVLVISKNKGYIRSIYELADERFSAISKLKPDSKGITVAASEGFLVLLGEDGHAKVVDMSTYRYPRKNTLDKILSQPVVFADVVKTLDHELVINGSLHVSLADIPMQSITANGRRLTKSAIKDAQIV